MVCAWTVRALAAVVLMGRVWSVALAGATQAWGQGGLDRLRSAVSRLPSQGKCADASPVAEQFAAVARQRRGEEHAELAAALAWLGLVYQAQGRYAEAEPLLRRDLAITEKA